MTRLASEESPVGSSPLNKTIYGNLRLARDVEYLGTAVNGETPCPKSRTMAVMMCLAINVYPDKGYTTYMTQAQIAGRTGWDVRSVQRALNDLETADLISRRKRFDGSDVTTVMVDVVRKHSLAVQAQYEGVKVSPPADTLVIEDEVRAPAPPQSMAPTPKAAAPVAPKSTEPPPALVRALRQLSIGGESLSEQDCRSMARTLSKDHGHTALILSIANLDEQTLARAATAMSPTGYLVSILANKAQALAAITADVERPNRDEHEREMCEEFVVEVLSEGRTGVIWNIGDTPATIDSRIQLLQDVAQGRIVIGDLEWNPNDELPLWTPFSPADEDFDDDSRYHFAQDDD